MFISNTSYERIDLLDFVGSKQNQSGILWGAKKPGCVIVTSGGRHGKKVGYGDQKNEDGSWFYIGQGSEGNQNPKSFANAILINEQRDVLLFSTREPNAKEVKERGNHRKFYTFEGIYKVASWRIVVPDEGKRKGDEMIEFLFVPAETILTQEINKTKVEPTRELPKSLTELRKKIKARDPIKTTGQLNTTEYYRRSKFIVDYAKLRADGVCERCNKPGPFLDSNNRPFLEVHHILMLSDDGPDLPENVAAICPNCHKETHFGITKEEINTLLLKLIRIKEETLYNSQASEIKE
jgi:5-methylcytosine-specific restriction protein A